MALSEMSVLPTQLCIADSHRATKGTMYDDVISAKFELHTVHLEF